jgi:hypothetical protein
MSLRPLAGEITANHHDELHQSQGDIRSYGASTAFGDNSTEIQDAIDGAGFAYIPPGTWNYASTLMLTDVTPPNGILGAGMDTSVLSYTGSGVGIQMAGGAAAPSWRGWLRHFELLDTGGSGTIGVHVNQAREIHMEDVRIGGGANIGFSQEGILFDSTDSLHASWNNKITRCNIVLNKGYGIYTKVGTNGLVVRDCHIAQNGKDGIYVDEAMALKVTGNIIEGNAVLSGSNNILIKPTATLHRLGAISITQNHMEVPYSGGTNARQVFIDGTTATISVESLAIDNNYMWGGGSSNYAVESNAPSGLVRGTVDNNFIHGVLVGGVLCKTNADTLVVRAYTKPLNAFYTGSRVLLLDNFSGAGRGMVELWGSGSPESSVQGAVSSIYHRTDGGAGTSLYIKETGAGNTGWVGK